MSISLYMDVHVPRAIARTLAAAGVNAITAQEDGCSEIPDPELLDRAGSPNRVLFTRDDDLLTEATRRQRAGMTFYGVIYAHQMRANYRTMHPRPPSPLTSDFCFPHLLSALPASS